MKKKFELSKEGRKIIEEFIEITMGINMLLEKKRKMMRKFRDLNRVDTMWELVFDETTGELKMGGIYCASVLTKEEMAEMEGKSELATQQALGYKLNQNEQS